MILAACATACLFSGLNPSHAYASQSPDEQDSQLVYQMNRGAVFSEDESIASVLGESLDGLVFAILRGEITHSEITSLDQERHSFFMGALKKLADPSGTNTTPPLVLKSFSPDEDETFLVTVAFMKNHDEGEQIEKIIEFHAYPAGEGYRFRSPLDYRTRNLETRDVGSVRYYFEGSLDQSSAEAFVRFKSDFEQRVGNEQLQLDYYRFETLDDLLRAYGIVYDCTRCNWLKNDLGFMDNNGRSFVTGTGDERFIFDYLVDYMSAYCDDDSDLYPPFVYGMAAYYGGYGLGGDDLNTLKAQFRDRLIEQPDFNLLDEYRKGRKSSVQRHFTNFVICAFICEDAMDRLGFDGMMRIARSGRSEDQFFESVEQLLGIDQDEFHNYIERLINS